MSKNVLVLSASPRKGGNSDLLCDQFMLGAKDGGHKAEKIFLNDKNINFCKACDTCQRNGGECIQNDDIAEILAKMIASDVIVMATPVYFYTMNGQMKTLIDRTYAKYTEIINKDIYFIATAANPREESLERTIEGFRGFTTVLNNVTEKGILYGSGAWKMGDIKNNEAMEEAYEMGKNI